MSNSLDSKPQKKFTRTEKQLILLLKSVPDHFMEPSDAESVLFDVQLLHLNVQVLVSSEVIEIVAFHSETKELFVCARYCKLEQRIIFTLRFDVVEDCLRDLILFDSMVN